MMGNEFKKQILIKAKIESIPFLDLRHSLEWHRDNCEPLDDKHKYAIPNLVCQIYIALPSKMQSRQWKGRRNNSLGVIKVVTQVTTWDALIINCDRMMYHVEFIS